MIRAVFQPGHQGRATGADIDAVKQLLAAEAGDRFHGEVLGAHRGSARDDQHVVPGQQPSQLVRQNGGVLERDAGAGSNGAGRLDGRGERVLVHVPHLTRARLSGHGHQLDAGGQHRRAEATEHRHAGDSEGGQRRDPPLGQTAPDGYQRAAGGQLLPDRDHVAPAVDRARYVQPAVRCQAGVLHHDHRVRPGRQMRAGRDRAGFTGPDRDAGGLAHADPSGHRQHRRCRTRRARNVRGPHREPIHRRAGKRRHRLAGPQLACQHAPRRLGKGHLLDPEGRGQTGQPPPGLGGRDAAQAGFHEGTLHRCDRAAARVAGIGLGHQR
jgi:hypothetical protein